MKETYVLAHDIGTTGCKSCLYRISDSIRLVDSCLEEYPLYTLANGGVEQKVDEWWRALCNATKKVMRRSPVRPAGISGMVFCAQMQGLVLVDENGVALRNAMSYMDGRAVGEIDRYLNRGPVKIEGKWNALAVARSLYYTGGLAGTAKDPLWKYHWVKRHEPALFERVYKWLDVKDYLNLRCTGRFTMTPDSANLTFIYDTRPGKNAWNRPLCRTFDVDMNHLPEVIDSTDVVGPLGKKAAAEMGLVEGIPVFGGGGDVSLIAIGAGCLDLYDTHIYMGTSGWVASCVDKRMVDVGRFIASIMGAIPGRYNYVAEQETSGVCLQWVRDHLALDEIGVFLKARHVCECEGKYESLYDFLSQVVQEVPPGAGNVIFTPWLHGNRAPAEDSLSRGMFFNLGLSTGKRQLIRAVVEGIAFHKRWMLESIERKIPRRETLRFVGGGAKSPATCQIMADVTGRRVETIADPQNAGTIGATAVCAVGQGLMRDFGSVGEYIPVLKTYVPRDEHRKLYERMFYVFKKLYRNNRDLFRDLNRNANAG